tara:strand:- start:272 stop:757 length:486 start_codon:yes stop_codon:yes gene_type:complete
MKETNTRVIKKYPNRRLYDTEKSKYVTLCDLRELVMNQEEFIVIDKKSDEDITRSVLLQIILEQEETEGQPLFSTEFLHKLIGIYGDPNQQLAGNFLNRTIEMFCEQQKLLSAQMEEAMTVNPMSTLLTKMTKTNFEIWKEMQENLLKSMENPSPDHKSKK